MPDDTMSQLQQLQPILACYLGSFSTPEVSPWKSVINPLMRIDTTYIYIFAEKKSYLNK